MNLLHIDFEEIKEPIKEVYTEIYGEEYKNVIEDKLNKVVFMQYNNGDAIKEYLDYLKKAKKLELFAELLVETGDLKPEEVPKKILKNNEDLKISIQIRFGDRYYDAFEDGITGVMAWSKNAELKDKDEVDKQKKKFIEAYFWEFEDDELEKMSLEELCQKDKYKTEVKKEIELYLEKFPKYVERYREFEKELVPYQEYVDTESDRKCELEKKKRIEIYNQIVNDLPDEIIDCLNTYEDIDERVDLILGKQTNYFGYGTFYGKALIEWFEGAYDKYLDNEHVRDYNKERVIRDRNNFFDGLGLDRSKYVKGSLDKVAKKTEELREKARQEMFLEFAISDSQTPTLIDKVKNINKSGELKYSDVVKDCIRCRKECVVMGWDEESDELKILLFHSTHPEFAGDLDFVLLHEAGHCIDCEVVPNSKEDYRCGFDVININGKNVMNPLENNKRKYERLNETITDLFAIEARDNLRKKGIYFCDSPELASDEPNNKNSSKIQKKLAKQFLEPYRKEIIAGKITGDFSELFKTVGKENFEKFNDLFNKIDHLIKDGLEYQIKNGHKLDELVIEYEKQLIEVKKVFENMDKYKENEIDFFTI